MKAWTFTILRNVFLSEKRRGWRTQPLDPVVAESTLVANDDPEAAENLLDVRNAMQLLPVEQREALILAGSAGLTYEETAEIVGCAVGTVKSRVSRGREALAAILAGKGRGQRLKSSETASTIFESMLTEATVLRTRPTQG
jgi:RNA polymerase sigma-70 factor (ECF subfamily)